MKDWIKDIIVRAIKTAIQTFFASVVAVGVISEVDWHLVVIDTVGAFIISILMNVCSHFDLTPDSISNTSEDEDMDEIEDDEDV